MPNCSRPKGQQEENHPRERDSHWQLGSGNWELALFGIASPSCVVYRSFVLGHASKHGFLLLQHFAGNLLPAAGLLVGIKNRKLGHGS